MLTRKVGAYQRLLTLKYFFVEHAQTKCLSALILAIRQSCGFQVSDRGELGTNAAILGVNTRKKSEDLRHETHRREIININRAGMEDSLSSNASDTVNTKGSETKKDRPASLDLESKEEELNLDDTKPTTR